MAFIAAGQGRYERAAWLFGATAPLDHAIERALGNIGQLGDPPEQASSVE